MEIFSLFFVCIIIAILFIVTILLLSKIDIWLTARIRKFIIADIPFLQISYDSNFHTIDIINTTIKPRYSLIFIPFGQYKFYFLTYKDKFDFFSMLSLKEIYEQRLYVLKNNLDTELNEEYGQYCNEQNNKTNFIEIIKNDEARQKDSINAARTKGSFYFTLAAALIPICFWQIDNFKCFFLQANLMLQILTVYIAIIFLNFLTFLIHYISIKNINIEMFEDFKKENYTEKAYFSYFYKNKKYSLHYSTMDVGYIKNIEYYMVKLIIFSVIISILILLS